MDPYFHSKSTTKVLGIVGSLRSNSFNRALLNAAASYLPGSVEFETFDIEGIPHYNQDVEDSDTPEIVRELRQKVRNADAIFIATPEYNGSVTGALKDALDWASRPHNASPIEGKPVAVIMAVAGSRGGQSALEHLTRIIDYLDARLVDEPVLVRLASQKFGYNGRLTDAEVADKIRRLAKAVTEILPQGDEMKYSAIGEAMIAEPIENRN